MLNFPLFPVVFSLILLSAPAEAQRYAFWFEGDERSLLRGDLETSRVDTILTPYRPSALDIAGSTLYWADATSRTIRQGIPGAGDAGVVLSGTGHVSILQIDIETGVAYWFESPEFGFAEPGRIRRANLDGTGIQDVVTESVIRSFRLHADAGHLYWTDGSSIRRSNLAGEEVETILTRGDSIRDFEVDEANQRVYWSDPREYAVFRASLGEGSIDTVVADVFVSSLAIDFNARRLYYGNGGEIYGLSLDGAGTSPVVDEPPSFVLEVGRIVIDEAGGLLYWLEREHVAPGRLMRVPISGGDVEEVVTGLDGPGFIAVDQVNEHLYIAGPRGEIVRASWDGSGVSTILHGMCGFGWNAGLALDQFNGMIYWGLGPSCFGYGRANLDGSDQEFFSPSPYVPTSLAVDPIGGKLYWSGTFESQWRMAVLRTPLGSRDARETELLVEGFELPPVIRLDLVAGRIYWIEDRIIRRSNLDGTVIEDVLDGLGNPYGLSLDVKNDHMYWVEAGAIRRANLDGTDVETLPIAFTVTGSLELSFENSGVFTSSEPFERPFSKRLGQNYPNPFNPSTTIPFTLPEPAHVILKVYDLLGQQVATLVFGTLPAGEHTAVFNAANVATGVYLYRLTAGGFTETRRMAVVR